MKTEIIQEDKDILVIYKPAGLAVQTARVGQPDVVSELKNYLAADARRTGKASVPYLGVVHRLDQPVEGLLVFARNKKAAAALTAQLRNQGGEESLNKHYLAVLCGCPGADEGELVNAMYKDASGRAVVLDATAQIDGARNAQAKRAALSFRILDRAGIQGMTGTEEETEVCLADICIETGRFHQIRAQMAYQGTPLLGDMKYGSEASIRLTERLRVRAVALCAHRLEFLHPSTGEKLSFRADPRGTVFSLFRDGCM